MENLNVMFARRIGAFWAWLALACILLWCAVGADRTLAHAARSQAGPLVAREIRYHNPDASEVALVWGVYGWQTVPESLRPPGTIVQDGARSEVMRTPMERQGDVFVVRVQVPSGAPIDFIFNITRTRGGVGVDAWDANGQPAQDFHAIADGDGVTEVGTTIVLAQQAYTTIADSGQQLVGSLALLGVAAVLAVLAMRMLLKNPYLDF
jgi:hypothetical protein